jgi:hypothetical protein
VQNACFVRGPLFERDWHMPQKQELGVECDWTRTTKLNIHSTVFGEEIVKADLMIKHFESRWGEIWAELIPFN